MLFFSLALASQLALAADPVFQNPRAPLEARVHDALTRLTLEEKVGLMSGDETGFNTKAVPRLKIPAIHMTDGPLGVRDEEHIAATAFPAGIAMAATFEPALIARASRAMGEEARALGKDMLLGPCIDISRNPFGGRNFESFGEDPYLTSMYTRAYLGGLRGAGVIPSAKHFAVNDQEINRMTVNVVVSERALQEIHLPAFHEAVEGGAWTVMAAYNRVNGHYASENAWLLNETLKQKWGFKGFVVSDWGATHSTVEAANAGLDLEMPTPDFFGDKLLSAVKEGRVKESVIDDHVSRILRVVFGSGLFDRPRGANPGVLGGPEHLAIAREVAQNSIVLLKNDRGALPLVPARLHRLAVIGAGARYARVAGGGSSEVAHAPVASPLDVLRSRLPGVRIDSAIGVRLDGDIDSIPAELWTTEAAGGEHGLRAEYFPNQNLEGTPKVTRVDPEVSFDWGLNQPAPGIDQEHFSVRWTGYLHPRETREYRFAVRTDDGARLYVDGQKLVDAWYDRGDETSTAVKRLEAGKTYQVRLEYYQNTGGATASLGFAEPAASELEEAVRTAAGADAVLLFAGSSDHEESEGIDKKDMSLPGAQDQLIERVLAVNPNVIVVLNGGNPVSMPWLGRVKGLVHSWFFGQMGSEALADVLLGRVSPSGKLPVSFPKRWEDAAAFGHYPVDPGKGDEVTYDEGIYVGYRHFDAKKIEPLFPFGFGLSYSSFRYDNLAVRARSTRIQDPVVEVSFDLTNTGAMRAAEVPQLYVGEVRPSVDRPARELKGFERVELESGETKRVTMILGRDAFAWFDPLAHDWRVSAGAFDLRVGSSSRDVKLTGRVVLQ